MPGEGVLLLRGDGKAEQRGGATAGSIAQFGVSGRLACLVNQLFGQRVNLRVDGVDTLQNSLEQLDRRQVSRTKQVE